LKRLQKIQELFNNKIKATKNSRTFQQHTFFFVKTHIKINMDSKNCHDEKLYEIHVSVDPDQYILLKQVCLDEKLNYIWVKNDQGKNSSQLIITKWVMRGNNKSAIERALELANMLKLKGLKIVRTKVELELPDVDPDYNLKENEYWEFHIKVPIKNSQDYKTLEEISKPYHAVLSTLVQSKYIEFLPISTLRYKSGNKSEALRKKAEWVEYLKQAGFHLTSKMHQELCIFDDNVQLDEGWL